MRRLRDTGFAWKEGSKGNWEYSLPLTPGPDSLKWQLKKLDAIERYLLR